MDFLVSFIDRIMNMFVKRDGLDEVPAEHVEQQVASQPQPQPEPEQAADRQEALQRQEEKKVNITGINLKFMGGTHQIKGMEVKGSTFDIRIPFNNRIGNENLPDNLKGPNVVLSKITVDPPFRLVDVSPALPAQVEYLAKVVFTLRIAAPDMNWEGPMNVSLTSEPSNNVTVSIKTVTLHYKDKSVELEDSGVTSSMQKSQTFKQNVQLYKIISFGDEVGKVEVNEPFQIVSTDPALPIKADRKDSYIMGIYMKCPEFSYAGDLDIKFS